jgi:TPP-dependent pyruvate/acetoin dehydrogenase alpha subunit
VDNWLTRDPLVLARNRLLESDLEDGQVAAAEEATRERIERAIEAALAAPFPDPDADAREFRK